MVGQNFLCGLMWPWRVFLSFHEFSSLLERLQPQQEWQSRRVYPTFELSLRYCKQKGFETHPKCHPECRRLYSEVQISRSQKVTYHGKFPHGNSQNIWFPRGHGKIRESPVFDGSQENIAFWIAGNVDQI